MKKLVIYRTIIKPNGTHECRIQTPVNSFNEIKEAITDILSGKPILGKRVRELCRATPTALYHIINSHGDIIEKGLIILI